MRVFLAGATGVIGARLVPPLVDAGHIVAGMTRSQPQLAAALGAEPVVCDVYDAAALRDAVLRFGPDLVLHELTDLPDEPGQLDSSRAANRRMRTEGTRNLLAAAGDVKTVAQSTAFPAATEEHERLVLDAGGVILRYGMFYGPGTWYSDGEPPPPPRVHIDQAAERTIAALDSPPGTILELVDR
jgi:nucleoside-diphosphate-sugar epimerase